MTALQKAWRRMMLIVLMPDSVMGRVPVSRQDDELAPVGAVRVREQ